MGRSPHPSLKRSLLLSTFAVVSLLAASSLAADATTTAAAVASTETTTAAATSTSATDTVAAATTTTSASSASSSSSSASTATSATDASTDASSTGTGTASSDMPTISSSSSTTIPTYPAPSVPSTANSPFMRYSNAPDGTVFIAVGAILGAFALAVLVWRAAVAYMLHRSIARAAREQHAANDKAAFLTPHTRHHRDETPYSGSSSRGRGIRGGGSSPGGGSSGRHRHRADGAPYNNRGNGSPPPGRGVRRTSRAPVPSTPSASNLFFSPTAPGAPGAAGAAVAVGAAGNRDSRLLPAGFYAAGAAAAASSSPSNSPAFSPRASVVGQNMSGSSINLTTLTQPPSGRVPSAFLDDLLDDNSGILPPPGGMMHNRSYSNSSQGR